MVTAPEMVPPDELNLVLDDAKALFAYTPLVTARWSAVAAFVVAVLA
jgi:hypothetical protein